MRSVSQIRAQMLVLSLVLGLSAFIVQNWKLLPLEEQSFVSGQFKSELLADSIPIEALQVKISSPAFEGAVEAHARIEKVNGNPDQFRLIVNDSKGATQEVAFQRIADLIEQEIRTLALAEVDAKKKFLQQAENDASAPGRSAAMRGLRSESEPAVLSSDDIEMANRLRHEIEGLEAFIQGKKRPVWLDSRLSRPQLKNAQKDVARAEAELLRLSDAFTPNSAVIREQNLMVAKAKKELKQNELHFAKLMLSTHQSELKSLEARTAMMIRQNRESGESSSAVAKATDDAEKTPEGVDWLQARSRKLELESKAIEAASKLTPIGEPASGKSVATGYWVCLVLWMSSLVSLLGALFSKGEVEVVEVDESALPTGLATDLASPLTTGESRTSAVPQLIPELSDPPDKLRYFFEHLCSALESGLGHRPNSLLILGGVEREDRSSLSIRIAKGFSNDGKRVRLIDFDLQDKALSKRLGDSRSAGVGDVLSSPGPVDEFFASVPDSLIQFAPAGTRRILQEPVCQQTLKALLKQPENGVVLVEAGFTSPLHLFAHKAEAVLCLSHPQKKWSDREKQVLIALRELKVPVWGISKDRSQLFPFL